MIEPKEYKLKKSKKTICVVDTETDPFGFDENGDPVMVKPFSLGFFDGAEYQDFWGDDCCYQFFKYLKKYRADEELLIYAHNGGRFDFMFFLPWMNPGQSPFMIDGRIVQCHFGSQEFRDSYKIMPFPLAEFKKTPIDYSKFTRDRREGNKREIQAYQKDDCVDLYTLVIGFHELFGDRLTIASTALPLLNSHHGFQTLSESQDDRFRSFYFGGRVQCFEAGVIRTPLKVLDVNSMYPHVMRSYRHPVGNQFSLNNVVGDNTFLLYLHGLNNGALCQKADDGSLSFTQRRGDFYCTIHEYRAGLETGTLNPLMIKHCWDCEEHTTFDTFVDTYYGKRLDAKKAGDLVRALFYKYILNSSYGKFSQDPRRYEEFMINYGDIPCGKDGTPDQFNELENPAGWYPHSENQGFFIWARESKNRHRSFKNVTTGASITGAARAELLLGISKATRPLYCDTDSIICTGFAGREDASELGAWKTEAEGDMIAIAGKKLYAVFSKNPPEKLPDPEDDGIIDDSKLGRLYCIKKASKGAHLTAAQIVQIARGEVVRYVNPVPNFRIDGSAGITARTIRRTV